MLITLSRQYGAGGSAVAERVADGLGWRVLDDELVRAAAERTGYAPEQIEALEERPPTFLERWVQSATVALPENLFASPASLDPPDTVRLARVMQELVAELGHRGRMVLVGRAAAAVLAGEQDALHVRLVAPVESRVREASLRLGLPEHDARARLEEFDRNRARYHRELYGRDWNDPVHYHMVLNTTALGREGAADLILARASALGWGDAAPEVDE